MRKKGFKYTVLTALAILTCFAGLAQLRIEKVVPMTSDDHVKLEVRLSSDKKFRGKLNAKIVACQNDSVIWDGTVAALKLPVVQDTALTFRIDGINAELWTPSSPNLYRLEVNCGGSNAVVRVGFRKFEMVNGRFLLNGKPIFLRGNAINPPHRGIPEELEASKEFARDYVRFMKGMNINIIRIPDNQNWMDVCDEEGMMIFGGRYGRPKGGTREAPPQDMHEALEKYKEVDLGPFVSHPSVVIYTLSNEMPTQGPVGEAYMDFLSRAHKELLKWDDTRLYIGNAGYGMGRAADVYDVHRYWGWYYNTFLTYLNLRDMEAWQNEGRVQAITFTECVGNYTGVDGAFNLCSRTKQPGSQKCWTGHLPAEEQSQAALEYQAFMLKSATEMFRRMRVHNPRLSGIMPFTIMFHDWDGVRSFAEMKPKPAAYQYGISYQPVLLSWENWQTNVYAGADLQVVAHVVNDDDLNRDLDNARVVWWLENADRIPVISGEIELPSVPYYGTYEHKLILTVPENIPTGYYTLQGSIMCGDRVVSSNSSEVFVAGRGWNEPVVSGRPIKLYDPEGKCAAAFNLSGIDYETVDDVKSLKASDVLVIAEYGWDERLAMQSGELVRFAENGGRIVCLRQKAGHFDTSWIPVQTEMLVYSNNDPTYVAPSYTFCDGMNINIERPEHPVFSGLSRKMFRLWSDYTGYDESKPGFPAVYPVTDGFVMRNADLTKVQILADYSRGISGVALCEVVCGKGSILLSAFDLTSRCGLDPIAEKMLCNLLGYAGSDMRPQPYKLIENPIWWGDFASEDGLVTGANNGLVVNPYPIIPLEKRESLKVVVDELGFCYAGSYGGWNSKPGVQYKPYGRRPFAPFSYSRGGSDIVRSGDEACGTGYFVASVPQGRTKMINLLENLSDEAIRVRIGINDGPMEEYTIAPRSQLTTETPLPSERELKVVYSGDRRTIIRMTDFQ